MIGQVEALYPRDVAEGMGLVGGGGALNDYSCGGQKAMGMWLSQPDVIAALHVKAGTPGMSYGPR